MLGRKIQNFTFRVGVFESTGGAGIDYEKFAWGSRFPLMLLIIEKILDLMFALHISLDYGMSFMQKLWGMI